MDLKKVLKELTLEEKAGLCSGADFWRTKAVERLGVGKAMMCDGPHGLRKQKGEGDHLGINESIEAVCFPSASALASSFDRDLLKELGEILGEECQAEDVAMLLGPGVNIKRSPLCGRNFEYFSEDPYLAGELGASYVKGLQSKGVAACVKHFAANNQETRRMCGSSEVEERTLNEIYLPAFEKVVKEGKTRSVMCSYNMVNGVFSAENKELLTDILRDRWGFDGFVVTDWGAVKNRVKGLEAGLDLEMPGGNSNQDKIIVQAVKRGILKEEILDNAVLRILDFINTYQENRDENAEFDLEKDRKKAKKIAEECAVLLKNEENILPLSKSGKYAFIGEYAKTPRYQGAGSSHINVKSIKGALAYVESLDVTYAQGYVSSDEIKDRKMIEEAAAKAADAEVAVIFAGLPNAYETEGVDRNHMHLPENQNQLIHAVAKVQPNTIVVLHGGAAVEMPWVNEVKAILNMHLGGECVGSASVSLLFGDVNPSGKLAETYPVKLEDNPSYLNFPGEEGIVKYQEGIYVGYRYYDKKAYDVLFPFGQGLSYTSFEYSELKVNQTILNVDEKLEVSCKIKNTGSYAGKEIVQLYVNDIVSKAARPVRELKGFEKILLNPGEEQKVSFILDKRAFAYYEEKIHDWYVENGEFRIEIGASSRDIRLSEKITIIDSPELPVTYTRNSVMEDLKKTERGRAVMQQMLGNMGDEKREDDVKNLGEGSDKMMEAMMNEMPLSAGVSFGRMTEEELESILSMLNGTV